MFFFNYYYFEYYIFMLPALILVFAAQIYVKSQYGKYSQIGTSKNITGIMAARDLMAIHGVHGVDIGMVDGQMTDHYHPVKDAIFLSQGVGNSSSIAAVGIAAHEAGHAVQHHKNYFPVKLRTAIVPVCNFGSMLAVPLCMFGAIFAAPFLVNLGIVFFGLAVLFQLVTLPVEFNASRRAIAYVKSSGLYTENEIKGVKRVLTAAALTYVAALAQSLIQMLYFVMRFSGRRRD